MYVYPIHSTSSHAFDSGVVELKDEDGLVAILEFKLPFAVGDAIPMCLELKNEKLAVGSGCACDEIY